MKKRNLLVWIITVVSMAGKAQDAKDLMVEVKRKLDKVNDYQASGKMKMNITFLKAPVADVKVFYKKPDKLRITNQSGISLIPKGAVNINMSSIIGNMDNSDIIDAGKDQKTGWRMIRLLPRDDNAGIVLSTLYIDEKKVLVVKTKTTTKENGTYELEMTYGRYADYGLADKVVCIFNTKDYKLPKGVTFDYDDGTKKQGEKEAAKDTKGTVEISYSSYIINKGVSEKVFQ